MTDWVGRMQEKKVIVGSRMPLNKSGRVLNACRTINQEKKVIVRRLTGHKYLRNKLSLRDVSSRRFFL